MRGQAARMDDRTLRRVIARLVALADLAERCATRSFLVRFLVLWTLRRAEAVAAIFFLEATGALPPAEGPYRSKGNGPADAIGLAARLCAMAAALAALLAVARRFVAGPGNRPSRYGGAFARPAEHFRRRLVTLDVRPLAPNDTS